MRECFLQKLKILPRPNHDQSLRGNNFQGRSQWCALVCGHFSSLRPRSILLPQLECREDSQKTKAQQPSVPRPLLGLVACRKRKETRRNAPPHGGKIQVIDSGISSKQRQIRDCKPDQAKIEDGTVGPAALSPASQKRNRPEQIEG